MALSDLVEEEQAVIWGLLQAIATLGARHPDRRANRVGESAWDDELLEAGADVDEGSG